MYLVDCKNCGKDIYEPPILIQEHCNNNVDKQYLDLVKKILDKGVRRKNRTGIDTLSLFGETLRFDLSKGFPILTTRKINYKNAFEEFLFMIRGETQTKKLEEKGVNIWKGNTSREFLDNNGLKHFEVGEIGEIYGWNLRFYGEDYLNPNNEGFDQVAEVIDLIRNNPDSRRIVMTTFNPARAKNAVLYPCHGLVIQFNVNPETKQLSLSMTQRSADTILGTSSNIIFYAVMLETFAKICNLIPYELIINMNDTHVYINHIKNAQIQMERELFDLPKLIIKKDIKTLEDIENMCFEDFELQNYKYHPHLKYEMAI